jgi:hypothetical protein
MVTQCADTSLQLQAAGSTNFVAAVSTRSSPSVVGDRHVHEKCVFGRNSLNLFFVCFSKLNDYDWLVSETESLVNLI